MARVAFVSGAGRGIGRAIALRLAARGDAVAVGDVLEPEAGETVAAIEDAGGRALAVPLDVTDSDSVARAIEQTTGALGSVEVLVNNAGWDEHRPFVETDEAFWDRVIEINFKGCLRLT